MNVDQKAAQVEAAENDADEDDKKKTTAKHNAAEQEEAELVLVQEEAFIAADQENASTSDEWGDNRDITPERQRHETKTPTKAPQKQKRRFNG